MNRRVFELLLCVILFLAGFCRSSLNAHTAIGSSGIAPGQEAFHLFESHYDATAPCRSEHTFPRIQNGSSKALLEPSCSLEIKGLYNACPTWGLLIGPDRRGELSPGIDRCNNVEHHYDPESFLIDLGRCAYLGITLSHWIEVRIWLSPDPLGFVDGPNLYAYVGNNPWSAFDPHGLANRKIGDVHISDDKLHQIPFVVMRDSKLHEEVAYWINALRLKSSHPHGGAGHFFYNQILKEQVPRIAKQMASEGLDPRNTANLSRQSAKAIAEELIRRAVTDSADEYVQWFNKATQTLSQEQIAAKSAIKEFEYRKARGMEIKGRLVTRLCDAALMGEELSDEINRVLTKRSRKFKIAMKGTAFATAGLTSLLFFYDPGEAVANLTGAETLGDATVSGGLTRSLEVADDPLLRYVLLTNKLWNEGLYGEEADELDFLTEELETEILTHQIVVGSSYIGAGFVWPLTINPYEGRENKQK